MEGIKNSCKMKRHRANTGNSYIMKRKNKLVLNRMGMRLNPKRWGSISIEAISLQFVLVLFLLLFLLNRRVAYSLFII